LVCHWGVIEFENWEGGNADKIKEFAQVAPIDTANSSTFSKEEKRHKYGETWPLKIQE